MNINKLCTPPARCDALSGIDNGVISYSPDMTAPYSVGTMATSTCNPGFLLVPGEGNTIRDCEIVADSGGNDADFNGSPPRCERKPQSLILHPSVVNTMCTLSIVCSLLFHSYYDSVSSRDFLL